MYLHTENIKQMIITFPHPPGSGGPGSFQIRFEQVLKLNDWQVLYAENRRLPDLVFIVGGTKRIVWLLKMKIKGIPIIYRLDGINWLHRKKKIGWKKYLMAEYRNMNNKLIHAYFANFIIYQSEFVKEWWNISGWYFQNSYSIIHNGIDLNVFTPLNSNLKVRLVCLEGTIDYSPYAVELLNNLRLLLPKKVPMELYGRFENRAFQKYLDPKIHYLGQVPRNKVQQVFQKAIYLSLDIHPACPNTVIEALACGAPVVAFDTGSLKELVPPEAGIIVPYGSDPWQLAYPDDKALCNAILQVYRDWNKFSKAARLTAERNYDINHIFNSYLKIINQSIDS